MRKTIILKHVFLSILLFCAGIMLSCCSSTWMVYDLSKSELKDLSLKAVKGDGEAAFRVGNYYEYSADSTLENYKKMLFWYTIGAENNYPNAHLDLSLILTSEFNKSNEKELYIRGIFWLYRLATIGENASDGVVEANTRLKNAGYTLETAKPPSDSLFSFNYATLTAQQRSDCEDGALRGSGKAALVIAQYYSEVAKDTDTAEYWYQIGAQNGNSECMYQFGNILSGKGEELDKERGKFWINRVNGAL